MEDEIEDLTIEIDKIEADHPEQLHGELRELKNRVLNAHANLEIVLATVLADKYEIDAKKKLKNMPVIIDKLSFINKLKALKEIDMQNKYFEDLSKLNSYRNEFAHSRALKIKMKYGRGNREAVKKLLADILKAYNSFFEYVSDSKEKILEAKQKEADQAKL